MNVPTILRLRLEGKSTTNTNNIWKDLLALRIVPELKKHFSEIGNVHFRSICNCKEA
jgi:hypothetical protein